MDSYYEQTYHKLERDHWWFKSRRNLITKILENLSIKKSAKILDIGCSSGTFIKTISKIGYSKTFGIDISQHAVKLCIKNKINNISIMDATIPAFKNNQFDLIIASDILEHLKNDSLALKQWCRILKPNGRMIIMVPAFNFLWSSHDLANHHFRRYTKDQLQAALLQAGLKIERLSYASISTFFPAVIIRFIQRLRPPKTNNFQLRSSHSGFNNILTKIVNFENSVLKYINYPFGVSVFAIVKK